MQNREYILLDEPTASLDVVSVQDVLDSIKQLIGKRTIILLAHDGKLLRDAGHVVVVEDDAKVYEGTAEEVIKVSGFFREMTDLGGEGATLSAYYYHNKDDAEAVDYCEIGNIYMGTYTLEGDKLTFDFEPDGYNTIKYNVGSDYAGLDEFKQFSYAEDGSSGIWAYVNAPWDYEADAVILEDVVKDLPDKIELTLNGSRITGWNILE